MDRRTVQLTIAGQNYRVLTSAPDDELQRLAALVSDRLAEVSPRGRPMTPQSMLLVAMSLAHELEAERERRTGLEDRTRTLLKRVLQSVDVALERESVEQPERFT